MSASARDNWRQAAQLLISNASEIKEAVNLSQVALHIGDSYEVHAKYGMLIVPWNLAPADLPSKMKNLLATAAGGSPATHGAERSREIVGGSPTGQNGQRPVVNNDESSTPWTLEGAVSLMMYVLTLLHIILSPAEVGNKGGGNRKETKGKSAAAWRGFIKATTTAVEVTVAFIFGRWSRSK